MRSADDYESYAAHFRSLHSSSSGPTPRSAPIDPSTAGQVSLRTEWNLNQVPSPSTPASGSQSRPSARNNLHLAHNNSSGHSNGKFAFSGDIFDDDEDALPDGLPGEHRALDDS